MLWPKIPLFVRSFRPQSSTSSLWPKVTPMYQVAVHGHEAPGPVGPGSTRPRAVAVPAIRPGRPWPTQILAWTTQMNFWPTVAGGLAKVIVHIF